MLLGVKRSIVDRTTSTDQSRPGGGVVPSSMASESRLAGPFAVVLVARIALAPAASVAVTATVLHAVQLPVAANAGVATTVPLTLIEAGRLLEVPLAYRSVSVTGCAAVA